MPKVSSSNRYVRPILGPVCGLAVLVGVGTFAAHDFGYFLDLENSPEIQRAVENEDYTLLRRYLRRGVDLKMVASLPYSRITPRMALYLQSNGVNFCPKGGRVDHNHILARAFYDRDFALLKALLEKSNPNSCDPNQPISEPDLTLLFFAVTLNDLEMAELLLKIGADVNRPASFGTTPLFTALDDERLPMTQLLLSYGANPNALTEDGLSPLVLASIVDRNPYTILLLLSYGADPDLCPEGSICPRNLIRERYPKGLLAEVSAKSFRKHCPDCYNRQNIVERPD